MNRSAQTKLAATLSTFDVVAVTVGVVLGASVFRTPPDVAANTGDGGTMLLAWLLGAAISGVGVHGPARAHSALCGLSQANVQVRITPTSE